MGAYMVQRLDNLKMSNNQDPDSFMKEKYSKDCYEHKVDLNGRYKCYMNMKSTKEKIKKEGESFMNLTQA
jgi:hypothetical protein